jgi:predicted esterase YcpF (UPF0227 family)
MQHLVYLHGFLSSPQSEKAQQTKAFAAKHYPYLNLHIPQLSGDIVKAVDKIDALLNTLPQGKLAFIGSSMGGFLSTYFVEKYASKFDARAVLINPAVAPYNLLSDYIGDHQNPYSQERFTIAPQSIKNIHDYYVATLNHPSRFKVLLQTDDETLDYRLAVEYYRGANMTIETGGNHSFVNYERHLADIFAFLIP